MMRPDPLRHHRRAEHLARAQRAGQVRVDDPRASRPRPSRASARAWSMPAAHDDDVDAAERRRGTRRAARSSDATSPTSAGIAQRPPAACLDFAGDLLDERRAPPGRDDVGAGVGQTERERAADAARAADDDGDAAGEIEQRCISVTGLAASACGRLRHVGLAPRAGSPALVRRFPAPDARWPASDARSSPPRRRRHRARGSPDRSAGASRRRRAGRARWRAPPSRRRRS